MSTFHESEITRGDGTKRFQHFVLGSQSIKAYSGNLERPYGDISGEYRPDYYSYYHGTDDNNTPTLFSHNPAGIHVDYMVFDPTLRIHAPTMVAHLHQKYNAPIVPSNDLSKYSSQLVEHAKKLGLPVTEEPISHHNSMELMDNTMNAGELDDFRQDSTMHEIPAGTMRRAKKHLRELRGKTSQKEKTAPTENVQLPGMEGF